MKAAVVTFPGSNCDDDIHYVLKEVCGLEVTSLWHKDCPDLKPYSLVVIPGGFSYGDYLRCGSMASLSPIMDSVRAYADNGGYVLGICNGFQILCESGLLPGALARNDNLKFICREVLLSIYNVENAWFKHYTLGEKLSFPIAHGEGRFIASDEEFERLEKNGQILLKYVDNPNGSLHNVAGICNQRKNVFALMPHPERAADLRSRDGKKFFNSLLMCLKESSHGA